MASDVLRAFTKPAITTPICFSKYFHYIVLLGKSEVLLLGHFRSGEII